MPVQEEKGGKRGQANNYYLIPTLEHGNQVESEQDCPPKN